MDKLKRIFRIAISDEEYFYVFYQKLAEKSTNKEVKERFLKLSEQEKGHKKKLEELYLAEMNVNILPEDLVGIDVSEITKHVHTEDFKSVKDMIKFAVKHEASSELFYLKLSELIEDKKTKDVLLHLSYEERMHKELLIEELND